MAALRDALRSRSADRHPAALLARSAAGARSSSSPVLKRSAPSGRRRVLRDYLRAEDPSLEISDVRADDYTPGTLLGLTSPSLFGEPRLVRVSGVEKCSDAFLSEALSYLAMPAGGRHRHPSAHRRDRARQEAPRRDPRRRRRWSRDPLPRDQARRRPFRLRGGRVPHREEAHRAGRARVRSSRHSPTTSPSSRRHASS